ncbi:MAG TPA: glycosyltransferase family 39 protein [Thermoflexales bacterium]|nr:glycosyltransferase family 39 protein [Thermoflexales bacterium]HQW35528.1 glycosyltransferase family 39 protein [Thermoflexales bacterium]
MGSTSYPSKFAIRGPNGKTLAGLLALILFHAAINFWWLKTDTAPPMWDEARHGFSVLQLTHLYAEGQPFRILDGILSTQPSPSLGYVIASIFVKLSWPSMDAMVGTGTLYLAILILSAYAIASHIAGRFAGLASAFLVSMYPIIFGLSRHFGLDVGLTALVALSLWALLKTNSFSRWGFSFLFGLSCGMGMLMKSTFIASLLLPTLLVFFFALANRKKDEAPAQTRIKNAIMALFVAAAVAGPWYARNIAGLQAYYQEVSSVGVAQNLPGPQTLEGWLIYLRFLLQFQIFAPFALLFTAGLILALARRKNLREIAVLVACVIGTYAFVTLTPTKDTRYTMPYLPAIACITGIGLSFIRPRLGRVILAGAIAVYAFIQFAGLTFGLHQRIPSWPARVEVNSPVMGFTLYAEDLGIFSPPRTEDWKTHDILQGIMQDTRAHNVKPRSSMFILAVVPNTPYISSSTLRFWAAMEQKPIDLFYGVAAPNANTEGMLLLSEYALTKTGDQGVDAPNAEKYTAALADPASDLGKQFVAIVQYPLPDGSTATIYRHTP